MADSALKGMIMHRMGLPSSTITSPPPKPPSSSPPASSQILRGQTVEPKKLDMDGTIPTPEVENTSSSKAPLEVETSDVKHEDSQGLMQPSPEKDLEPVDEETLAARARSLRGRGCGRGRGRGKVEKPETPNPPSMKKPAAQKKPGLKRPAACLESPPPPALPVEPEPSPLATGASATPEPPTEPGPSIEPSTNGELIEDLGDWKAWVSFLVTSPHDS